MKYQEIIIKLGDAYYRASSIDAVGVVDHLGIFLRGCPVPFEGFTGKKAATAAGLIMILMTLRVPVELHPPRTGVVVESFDVHSQSYEALVELDADFATTEAE